MPENKNFELLTREVQLRAESVDIDKREIRGIAVPFQKDANIAGAYIERFAKGAVQDSDSALLYWRHADPIGAIKSAQDTADGWEIVARVSETAQGNDALTLARDGVVVQLSVGFEPGGEYEVEEREDDLPVITRTKVRVREVSLVPFGAYGANATISEVRAASSVTPNERTSEMPEANKNDADILEIRETVEDIQRRIEAGLSVRNDEPAVDQRSAGAVLKAMVEGDESTITAYNRAQEHKYDELQQRAYTGGTVSDAPVRDAYVANLTRIYDASSGVQSRIFSRGTLPGTGMNLEFTRLKSNTLKVEQQVNEGDTLAYGKLQFENATAPIKTFGGYTELSRQAIERSSIPVLNTTLEALAIEAGRRKKIELRSAVASTVAARKAIATNGGVVVLGATLAASVAGNWEDALIDAAIKFDGLNADPEALVVSASVFKKLRGLTVSGERVFTVADKNASGSLNLPGLTGNLAGIPVYLDAGQTGDEAYFVNGRAIKQYDSALFSLSDENITNLTKQFSVYFYGAVADEFPELIVPVKLAAS
ncbi:HK97 family phage prohead protease [Microbacterium sp. cx-55]|uniref:HK97 family phage prohead protease n=1 Tax=Microbacterium sp. cx-55 TaxID=2875948 RepID=UPI001CBAC98F|nr:HK97 family phage prohead protease [Microbacterium sp. cx-55]MBZ4485993.1 HK97 family phage prohead protease [Microbacterium sp. cx-55]UGB34133.1 HK97 family phage prohead protease [Microbacterium sp. cx-55]